MNNTWRILTLDKEDSLELTAKRSQATQFVPDKLPAHIQPWSQTNQGPVAPEPKADKQNFAPVVALCPVSCFSLSSVFTRHLSITCNLPPPPLPLFHARLQNQLVCVTLGLRVSPQSFQTFAFVQKQQQQKQQSGPRQVRSRDAAWRLSSRVVYLHHRSPFLPLFESAAEEIPTRMQQRAQSLWEFNWEGSRR